MGDIERSASEAARFDEEVVALGGRGDGAAATPRLRSSPPLAGLRAAGTSHVYADTASRSELAELVAREDGAVLAEVDGNTANQPLVHKVLDGVLAEAEPPPAEWAKRLRALRPELSTRELLPFLYAVVCGRIGNDVARAFAAGRAWEVSLQLHMGLGEAPDVARRVGRQLRGMVPSAIVKVPFAPHAPECLLVARDLERAGIPVNFTSTFSARQAVAAAVLGDVARTNIFMGRLNQGLEAQLLGEHVDLEAQRALLAIRSSAGAKTQLIVASMHDWQVFLRTAGCDVYTAPCDVIRAFLEQDEVGPGELESQLETSYEDRLGIPDALEKQLGRDRIARLWRVEPEFVEFLLEYRDTHEYRERASAESLVRRFEQAGFGDFFYAPDAGEWREIRRSKLPDPDAALTGRLALDTLYSLLADADFEKHQREMDAQLEACESSS